MSHGLLRQIHVSCLTVITIRTHYASHSMLEIGEKCPLTAVGSCIVTPTYSVHGKKNGQKCLKTTQYRGLYVGFGRGGVVKFKPEYKAEKLELPSK